MTEQEKYLFDLQGYLTVPNALTPEQLNALNALMDAHIASDVSPNARAHRFVPVLGWGPPLLDVLDNPRITPYLEELLGSQFRLDHDYADVILQPGLGPIGASLHGGSTPFDPSQYFHFANGRMHNGLTVVAYNLRDVNPGDGGFAAVPGSHKANYSFPTEWKDLTDLHPCVRPVTGPAGTAILFTEAMTHGSLPWNSTSQRRTLFLKYSPHPVSWSARYYDADQYPGLTERQRALLEAPNARYGGRAASSITR